MITERLLKHHADRTVWKERPGMGQPQDRQTQAIGPGRSCRQDLKCDLFRVG